MQPVIPQKSVDNCLNSNNNINLTVKPYSVAKANLLSDIKEVVDEEEKLAKELSIITYKNDIAKVYKTITIATITKNK